MEARLVDSNQLGGATPLFAGRESSLIRSVNSNLRQRSEALADSEPIAFFCECADASCYSPMWMTAATFDRTTDTAVGWLLLDGHKPSALWHRREPLPVRRSRSIAGRRRLTSSSPFVSRFSAGASR